MDKLEDLLKDSNKEIFLNKIEETRGYVLEELKAKNSMPTLDFLLNNLTASSVYFILENYDLSKENNKKIINFINDNPISDNDFNILNFNKEMIESFLKEKKDLPKRVVLDLHTFKNFQNEIQEQLENNENMDIILRKSMRKFNMDDVLSLPKKDLKKIFGYLDVFQFKKSEHKEIYKNIALSFDNCSFRDFENYHFDESDKDLIAILLSSERLYSYSKYEDFKKLNGFEKIVSKMDYFENFNHKDLSSFKNKEIIDNKEKIQSVLENKVKLSSYNSLQELVKIDVGTEGFEEIFDNDFFKKIILKNFDMFSKSSSWFGYLQDYETIEERERRVIVFKGALDFFLDNQNIKMTTSSLIEHYWKATSNILDSNQKSQKLIDLKEAIDEKFRKLFSQNFDFEMKNENFTLSNKSLHEDVYEKIREEIKNKDSINALLYLSNMFLNSGNNSSYLIKQDLVEMGFRIAEKNKDLVLNVFSFLENEKQSLMSSEEIEKLKSIKNSGVLNDEENILSYEKNIENIGKNLFSLIFNIDKNFKNFILKNESSTISKELVHFCLVKIKEDDEHIDFLNKYLSKHYNEVIEDKVLLTNILASEKQSLIFKLEKTNTEENFKDLTKISLEVKKITERNEKIKDFVYDNDNNFYKKIERYRNKLSSLIFKEDLALIKENKEELIKEYAKNDKIIKDLKTEFQEKELLLGYEELKSKIMNVFKQKDFSLAKELHNCSNIFKNNWFEEFTSKMEYEDLIENIKNKVFFQWLEKSISYENKTNIKFKDFGNDKNINILKNLHQKFDSSKFLYFFNTKDKNFIKDFVVDNFPLQTIYSYAFLPEGKNSIWKNPILDDTPYSNEQMKRLLENMDKIGFFSYMDVNADYDALFRSQLESLKKNNMSRKDFLDYMKEENKLCYAILARSDIFNFDLNRTSEQDKKKNLSELEHDYFLNNFDFDAVMEGVNEVFSKYEKHDFQSEKEINLKLITRAINSVIFLSYYTEKINYGKPDEYGSKLSEENSKKLVDFLYEKNPLLLINARRVGAIDNLTGYIKDNIESFYDIKKIKNILLPENVLMPKYFHMEKNIEVISDILKVFVNHAISIKDNEFINNIKFELEQWQKLENENGSIKRKIYKTKDTQILEELTKDSELINTLKNANLNIKLNTVLKQKDEKIKSNKI